MMTMVSGHSVNSGCVPTASVSNVQRFSLHDRGGIRTVVFLKGCPFR